MPLLVTESLGQSSPSLQASVSQYPSTTAFAECVQRQKFWTKYELHSRLHLKEGQTIYVSQTDCLFWPISATLAISAILTSAGHYWPLGLTFRRLLAICPTLHNVRGGDALARPWKKCTKKMSKKCKFWGKCTKMWKPKGKRHKSHGNSKNSPNKNGNKIKETIRKYEGNVSFKIFKK